MPSPITFPGTAERLVRLEQRLREAECRIAALERELKESDTRVAANELALEIRKPNQRPC